MTEPLNFIRVPLQLDHLWRVAAERGWLSERGQVMDEGLALHHALSEVFGPGAMQPFRLMVMPRAKTGSIYAYSAASPDELKENAALCPPEYERIFKLGGLEAKPMPTDFQKGRQLGFDVRLRPVRRSRTHSDKGSAREMDAFLHEALSRFPDEPPSQVGSLEGGMATNGRSRETVYRDWLAERLDGAAILTQKPETRLAHFRRSKVVRNKEATEGPDAILQGQLIIQDPGKFANLLQHGIGRHKAYGYGMLLLRPGRRA